MWRAEYAGKYMWIEHNAIWKTGNGRGRATTQTLFVDGEDFEQIGVDFEKEHAVGMTQIGQCGCQTDAAAGTCDYAATWMEKKRV